MGFIFIYLIQYIEEGGGEEFKSVDFTKKKVWQCKKDKVRDRKRGRRGTRRTKVLSFFMLVLVLQRTKTGKCVLCSGDCSQEQGQNEVK